MIHDAMELELESGIFFVKNNSILRVKERATEVPQPLALAD